MDNFTSYEIHLESNFHFIVRHVKITETRPHEPHSLLAQSLLCTNAHMPYLPPVLQPLKTSYELSFSSSLRLYTGSQKLRPQRSSYLCNLCYNAVST